MNTIEPHRKLPPPQAGYFRIENLGDGVCRLIDSNGLPASLVTGDLTAASLSASSLSPVWEDLRFPSSGINPPGAASDPARSVTTGLLEFAGNADNVIAGVVQMPHAWMVGSSVRPHLHLLFPTASVATFSKWSLEYIMASPNGQFNYAYGSYGPASVISIINPNSPNKHVVASFPEIHMLGLTESTNIMWRITRRASTDAEDTDTSAIVLLDFDLHYQSNKRGSVAEY